MQAIQNEVWIVLYDKILGIFEERRHGTRWVYYPKLTSYQCRSLEIKLIEIFLDFKEDNPHVIRGLQETDECDIMEKTTCMKQQLQKRM